MSHIITCPPKSLLRHSFYCLLGDIIPLFAFSLVTVFFSTLDGIMMLPNKSVEDAADRRILLVPRTLVSTPVHKTVAAHKDSVSVMAKSTGCSTSRNDNTDGRTLKTKGQDSLCQFGIIKSNIANYVWPFLRC